MWLEFWIRFLVFFDGILFFFSFSLNSSPVFPFGVVAFGKLMTFSGQLIYFAVNLWQLKPTNPIFYNYITFFLVYGATTYKNLNVNNHIGVWQFPKMCSFSLWWMKKKKDNCFGVVDAVLSAHETLINFRNFVVTSHVSGFFCYFANATALKMWEELMNWFSLFYFFRWFYVR